MIIKKIKQYLFTYYDPNTDRIIGAEEGSLAYFHEYEHKLQHKSGLLVAFQMWSWYLMMGAIYFIVFNRNFYAKVFIIISVFLISYLEIDAWIYAFKKYYSKKW